MKKTIGAVICSFMFSLISAQVTETAYAKFYKDSTYYALGDQVNIRLNPDTAAKVIHKIAIGTQLRMLEVTEIPYTKNGYTANWCRVLFNNNGTKAEGYIWGGFIASTTVKSTTEDGDELLFMYGVSKVIKTEYYDDVYLQVRACKGNIQVAKLDIQASGGLRTYNTAESMGSKGVDGIKDIFKINFSDGYCGGAFGDAYFFWDGKTLFYVKTLDEGFDAPYFGRNDFIFPTDKNGKKGYIINKSESGFYGDDDKEHIEEWKKITYTWNGEKLVVVKTEKKK